MLTPLAFALSFTLTTQTPAAAQEAPAEAAKLVTASGTIAGTLVVPATTVKMPVVLIIAGSGPTDRDGNSAAMPGKNDAYRMLAEALAAEGIASLRYDKRGIGESRAAGGSEKDLRFENYVDDATAWVKQLLGDARFSRVVVVGHSEGSLIGMLAAGKAHAHAFVSIAGVAHRASDVLRDQLRPQIGAMPALWQGSESILTSLEAGTLVEPLPEAIRTVPGLASLFRPSVQPYLISWFKYLPSAQLTSLTIPVLILQGTTDIQVGIDEAKALQAEKPEASLLVLDGMNHVMKHAPADRAQNVATYGNPALPIFPEVPKAIADLARRVGRQ